MAKKNLSTQTNKKMESLRLTALTIFSLFKPFGSKECNTRNKRCTLRHPKI